MMNTIKKWFDQYTKIDVNHLKNQINITKIVSLLLQLSDTYKDYFERKIEYFIKHTFIWFVRRFLYNRRRRRHHDNSSIISKNTNFVDKRNVKIFFFQHVLSFISQQDSILNIILKTRNEDDEFVVTKCTIENILTNKMFFDQISFVQRMFLRKWRDFLNENMNISIDFEIYYQHDENMMKIKIDRHLKTTFLNDEFLRQRKMSFRITLLETTSDNVYFVFTKWNDLLTRCADSTNENLQIFNVDQKTRNASSEDEEFSTRKKRKVNDSFNEKVNIASSKNEVSLAEITFNEQDSSFIESFQSNESNNDNHSTVMNRKSSSTIYDVSREKNILNAHDASIIEFVTIDSITKSKSMTSLTIEHVSRAEDTLNKIDVLFMNIISTERLKQRK